MKRKYADLSNWDLVDKSRFNLKYIEDESFSGYIALIILDKVVKPLNVKVGGEEICIASDGYNWLRFFPNNKNYSLLSMFDKEGNIIQWYFDICKKYELNEKGIPYYDDLYLDVVVMPDLKVLLLDEDELKEALEKSDIIPKEFEMAYETATELIIDIKRGRNRLIGSSRKYLEHMISFIES